VSHGVELTPASPRQPKNTTVAGLVRALAAFNRWIIRASMLALVLTSCVLTYSVFTRYFFQTSNDWQDELSVFMLVGATFLSCAYVQSQRGHIGIEAIAGLLPAGINRVRALLVDVLSLLFCLFFTWKSWALFYEAWSEGQTTSSSFAPPLWIPYALMAAGMSLLTLQLFVQSLVHVSGGEIEGDRS
jgi:TRAP-type C4-dicarboxylate transport system permease small subunit